MVKSAEPIHRPAPSFPKKKIHLLVAFGISLLIWFGIPCPHDLDISAWRLFAIFAGTIYAVITQPFPLGTITFIALAALTATKLLTFEQAFIGFSDSTVWLIVFAFFIARGFIKTGLGNRISYLFMRLLGKHTLGLAYGVVATDLLLAPAIPSVTARSGGIVYPILTSIARSCGSLPLPHKSANDVGSFLTKVAMQSTCITSAMFLTAMSANPLICKCANKVFKDAGLNLEITWGSWALAALVPGVIALAVVPLIIYKLYPPVIKSTPNAQKAAQEKLDEMGAVSNHEWLMIGVFALLIVLWSLTSVKPALSALFGLTLLMLTGVLTWSDVKNETTAWETLVWFGVLLMMAMQLEGSGMTKWIGLHATQIVSGLPWTVGFGLLSIFYFYLHYFFASNLAQVGAMYLSFLGAAVALGTPPTLAALVLGFFSSLFGALTPYSSGPAAILYDGKYVEAKEWWQSGFIISIVNIIIWLGVGSIWWKAIGLF